VPDTGLFVRNVGSSLCVPDAKKRETYPTLDILPSQFELTPTGLCNQILGGLWPWPLTSSWSFIFVRVLILSGVGGGCIA
jgi:hypothetical protein